MPKASRVVGLVPDEAPGDRGGVHIEGRDIGGAPPSARGHKTLKASPHLVILAGKAPDRLTAKPGVLVKRIERHAACAREGRDRESQTLVSGSPVAASQMSGTITVIGSRVRASRDAGCDNQIFRYAEFTKRRQQRIGGRLCSMAPSPTEARREPGGDRPMRQGRVLSRTLDSLRSIGRVRHRLRETCKSRMIFCPDTDNRPIDPLARPPTCQRGGLRLECRRRSSLRQAASEPAATVIVTASTLPMPMSSNAITMKRRQIAEPRILNNVNAARSAICSLAATYGFLQQAADDIGISGDRFRRQRRLRIDLVGKPPQRPTQHLAHEMHERLVHAG